jgi:hypothetical protein
VTPTLSVEGLQVNVICLFEVAAASRFIGAVGGRWLGSGVDSEFGEFQDAVQP